jgi:GNAT superfamily N-acetyltransferase
MLFLVTFFISFHAYSYSDITIDSYKPEVDRQILIKTMTEYAHWLLGNDSMENALTYLENQPHLSILHVNHDPVGFINYEIRHTTWFGFPWYKYGFINGLAIDTESQSKGYGSILFKHAIEQLKKNVSIIYIRVNIDNHKAIDFYKKFGFKIISTIKENDRQLHILELQFPYHLEKHIIIKYTSFLSALALIALFMIHQN